MRSIFEFDQYKEYVNTWLNDQPKNGRGLLGQIAKKLNIHTTLLSHTLRGDKNLSAEQAILLADFIGLQELETDFFLLLLQHERAGNFKLKEKYARDIRRAKANAHEVAKRVVTNTELTDVQKAQFYSSWLYSAVRQLSCIPEYQNVHQLAEAFPVPRDEFNRVLNFLLNNGLCIEKNGKIKIGPANTHIEAKSPFVYSHHKNWRIKALEKHNGLRPEELMYSAPFTISDRDFAVLREETIKLIQKLISVADKTSHERLACLNVDLFFIK